MRATRNDSSIAPSNIRIKESLDGFRNSAPPHQTCNVKETTVTTASPASVRLHRHLAGTTKDTDLYLIANTEQILNTSRTVERWITTKAQAKYFHKSHHNKISKQPVF